MPNVGAEFTASIVIDKNDLIAQALKQLSTAQKELEKNKLEIYFDLSNADLSKKLKEYQKQLSSTDYTIKINNNGIEETYKSLDKLLDIVKTIASGKDFGTGNGIGNSIADEKQLKTIIDLFTKMESHLSSMKKVFSDVGDGQEFSPLLSTINKIDDSISKLSSSVKGVGLNMNIDFGSDKEMEVKAESKISNALQAYQRLFDHIKMSSAGGSIINTKFFDFDINQYDTAMSKLQAYRKFIENMRNEAKVMYGGQDVLYTDTDKKYWTQASSAMGQVTKVFNEMKAASNTNPLEDIFGKTDLTEVLNQLTTIVSKLDEISVSANKFSDVFKNGLNVNASVEEIDKLTNRVKELEVELTKIKTPTSTPAETNISSGLKGAFQGDEVEKASEAISNAVKEENNILEQNTQKTKENAEAKEKMANADKEVSNIDLSKYNKKLESYNTKADKYQATANKFKDGGWTSDVYTQQIEKLNKVINEYKTLLASMQNDSGLVADEDIDKLNKYESEIKEVISTVSNMSAAEKGFSFLSAQKELDKINSILNENTAMSREAKAQIRAYYAEIKSGNPSASLDVIHAKIMEIVNAEVEAGRGGKSMWSAIKEKAWYGVAGAIGTYFGFNDFLRYGREAIDTIVELDDALVDLKKTTAMSSSELENFYYDANDVAKQMGVTTQAIIDQASAWSRLGYNTKEQATEMAKLSSQFASISPGMDTDTAQEGLVSIMKAWDIDYSDVKSEIMDNINALGNSMAENNQDIVEGMERSAAALAAVGTSYEDAFAMFSGIQEVLQNAEVSGRALRSISMRIRGYDESTEELSSDLENITGELVDLTKTTEHTQGVSIFKPGSTTEFKSLVDYFEEIHDIWDEMSQKQQNDFLQKAFGKTQAQAGAALIQNYSAVTKSLEVMDNAAGSSDKEMDTVKQSITYKLNALEQTWIGTVQNIVKRGDLGTIIDSLTKLSEAIGFVLDKFGLIPTVLSTTGIVAFIKSFS